MIKVMMSVIVHALSQDLKNKDHFNRKNKSRIKSNLTSFFSVTSFPVFVSLFALNFIFFIFFIFISTSNIFGAEPQFWQDMIQPIGNLKEAEINFAFRQHYRFSLSEFKHVYSLFSLLTSKALTKNLEANINYSMIQFRSINESLYTQAFRLECELNPSFNLKNDYSLKIRNRYQIRKDEYEPKLHQTFRQRLQLTKLLHFENLKSISMHNEIFYFFNEDQINEDRFVPLQLTFQFKNDHSQSIYTMIRWRKTNNKWNPQSIIGSAFSW